MGQRGLHHAVEQQIDVIADEAVAVDLVAIGRAGGQRVLVQAQHDQWQHQRMHRAVDVDRSELAAGDAAPQAVGEQGMGLIDNLAAVVLGDGREVAHLGDEELEHAGGWAVVQLRPPPGEQVAH